MGKVYNNLQPPVIAENELTVDVMVNGERRHFPHGTTLLTIVAALGLEPERLAIEFNRAILKRPLWASTTPETGAQIEIVQFVGGG